MLSYSGEHTQARGRQRKAEQVVIVKVSGFNYISSHELSGALSSTTNNSPVRLSETCVRSLKWTLGCGVTICGHYNTMEQQKLFWGLVNIKRVQQTKEI